MQTRPLRTPATAVAQSAPDLFLRTHRRKKDGKFHRYWSIVESVRTPRGVYQRACLYHGELCDLLDHCVHVNLRQQLRGKAPGLTPRAVLDKLATVQMLDVNLPTTDGRLLPPTRYTEPGNDVRLTLQTMGWKLPAQSPPRLSTEQTLLS